MTTHRDPAAEPVERLLDRVERMVVSGRVTEAEAARVRDAADDAERAAAVEAIRQRHSAERAAKDQTQKGWPAGSP